MKPIEEKELDRPGEKGRIKRLGFSMSSKSTCSKSVVRRVWDDSAQGRKAWQWSFTLVIWSNGETHGVTLDWRLKQSGIEGWILKQIWEMGHQHVGWATNMDQF